MALHNFSLNMKKKCTKNGIFQLRNTVIYYYNEAWIIHIQYTIDLYIVWGETNRVKEKLEINGNCTHYISIQTKNEKVIITIFLWYMVYDKYHIYGWTDGFRRPIAPGFLGPRHQAKKSLSWQCRGIESTGKNFPEDLISGCPHCIRPGIQTLQWQNCFCWHRYDFGIYWLEFKILF